MHKRTIINNVIFLNAVSWLLIVSCVCAAQAQTAVDINRKFTPEQLIEDVDFYLKTLEEAHVNPYVNISAKKFRAKAEKIKSEINRRGAMTQKEFWLLFTPLVAAIGDSHCIVMEPRFFIKAEADPIKYLPVRTAWVDNKIVVTGSFADQKVEKGAVITAVNDITARELIRKLSDYKFGTAREKSSAAAEWLWVGAAELFGHPAEFTLSLAGKKRITVNGMKLPELMKRERAAQSRSLAVWSASPSANAVPLELKFLNDNTAYLIARTFDYDLEKYKTLLADAFTRIKASGVRNLIVDIRTNGGGNSALGDALLDMFNSKTYRLWANKWKRSAYYAEKVKNSNFSEATVEKYLAARPGNLLSSNSETIHPGANPLRFCGRVYVLSGEKTFSSGLIFLGLIKDNALAKIIGEQPNEPACHFGEMSVFKLPHSGLRASVSVKFWMPPAGCKGARGVVPNMVVKTLLADYLTGRDAILETTLGLIKYVYRK